MKITFTLDKDIKLDTKDCSQFDIASVAVYCILALAQDTKSLPDEVVADLLRICKGCLKQA